MSRLCGGDGCVEWVSVAGDQMVDWMIPIQKQQLLLLLLQLIYDDDDVIHCSWWFIGYIKCIISM